ncbi:RNA polymerase [Alphaproteobacteria bacterium GH1-50]|uniref:RNA polymerase n=1 Tax=Kangsaoukella pontilimi TaxID=2691042 RepID=A0A7C9NDK1_9RHOB|nr:RNA polymerase sigma factor [Kangsaoukella pontilimi]MXQ07559.1 RNA polymerase [Kangsaoukella pontilimi]
MSDRPPPDLKDRIARILREDRGRLIAALIRATGDFHLAEDALSDAFEKALQHWGRSGMPDRPDAWLLQVGRRQAIDRLRKQSRHAAQAGEIRRLMDEDQEAQGALPPEIPDDRLKLIFTCCHPALDPKSRVALTLRTVGGLTTRDIARAFLDSEIAMGQRLSRAKSKIAKAGIPYRVPDPPEWEERLGAVLTVIYLVFNEGWSAGPGEAPIRSTLCDEAIFLARLLLTLAPDDPEIEGLLALMLLTFARHGARLGPDGAVVTLDEQDRGLWNSAMIDEGLALLDRAVARGRPGAFQLQAAIGALHVQAASPAEVDWPQIALLYDRLAAVMPTPVVRLNRAVAHAEAGAPEAALSEIETLLPDLDLYQPFHAARADIAARLGQGDVARASYRAAIEMSRSDTEKRWLAARLARVRPD